MIANIKKLCEVTRNAFERGKNLSDLEESQQNQWRGFFERINLRNTLEGINLNYKHYDSNLGSLVFESVLDEAVGDLSLDKNEDEFMEAIEGKFKEKKDKRGEIGQVLSHTTKNKYHKRKRFYENASSVVLILAKDKTKLPLLDENDELVLESSVCADMLDFRSFDPEFAGMTVCKSFFYHSQLIPNCMIFGSGCFIASDKIVTAAHVLEAIMDASTKADDLLFIRGHWIYSGKDMVEIRIKKDQVYELAQEEIIDNDHIIYGATGDIAWLKVKPYYGAFGMNDASGYTGHLNVPSGKHSDPPEKDNPVYAIGHGLGVPMKLSFGSSVEFIDQIGWMGCDMDVFPGNSGSPIFHSNSHELIGVVSGANGLGFETKPDPSPGKNCLTMKVFKDGVLTVINTQFLTIIPTIPFP